MRLSFSTESLAFVYCHWFFFSFHFSFLAYEDVRIIERLFSSSLIALVSSRAPRKLKVCHFKKGTEICSYTFANTILAVKLNRSVNEKKVRFKFLKISCFDFVV